MEERGVTPVFGEILLIAIVFGLAASVGLVAYSWAVPRGYGPNVALILWAENVGENITITIVHQGGEVLNSEDLKVLAEDNEGKMIEVTMENWPIKFSLDEKADGNYHYGSNPQGKEISVNVIHNPSGAILLSVVALIISGG